MFGGTASLLNLALCTLIYRTAFVGAASTSNAPIAIERQGWVVTTDNAMVNQGGHLAVDNDPNTHWHTAWGPDSPLPHWITIDMRNQYIVSGFSYQPRQDASNNGNIGQHLIQTSSDGVTWKSVAQGTWANDKTVKTSLFTPTVARWVRLTAYTEASGTGKQWSSAAEINILRNPHANLPRANWAVKADSEQVLQQSWAAKYAIDESPTTYWHTQFVGTPPPLPHYFTIDQGIATAVGGISYLPRPQSSGSNGRIGQYKVQRSDNGNTWSDVVSGTWADTRRQKFAEWSPISARYWRLVAITEAGNRGPWTSAAEINLLDGGNQLANFRITVDSEQTALVNNSAVFLTDTDPTTFWHTPFIGNNLPGYPHYVTIDMLVTMPVKALQYVPRQDGEKNGNIGQHRIEVSMDGNSWTVVATGAFADNSQAKLVNFAETNCRYVRLTALSEAGNRGPWASGADVALSYDSAAILPTPQTRGAWGLTVNFPLVPVAVSLIPTGEVLAWSSWNEAGFGWTPGGQTITATYNPTNGMVSKAMITNTRHDMFCPGISLDFEGRSIITGGNDAPRTSIYSATAGWISAPDMKVARGYQSSATLSNGWIFTIGGSWSGGIFIKNGEYYNPSTNTWTMLNGADVTPMLTNDREGLYRSDNHGWLFGWKNQAVFQAGPSKAMNWYYTTGNGGVTGAGQRSDDNHAMCGMAVMYDSTNGKILTVGGSPDYTESPASSNAYIVTIGNVGAAAQVEKLANMNSKRIYANAVVLPNGQVFVAGGQDYGSVFNDDSSMMYPELWTPETKQWTVMAPMSVPRNYHSVAILMPDATVLVGGGGLCDMCEMNHYDAQIFEPPYLFTASGAKAARPTISSVSTTTVRVGGVITITSPNAVGSFTLVRFGSSTHTVNTDQRRIRLAASWWGGNTYTVTIPNDAGIALPGYWMLFLVDTAGVPSVARTIKVTL